MREGTPSATARRVAAHRLGFERVAARCGDPVADERLARDVVGAEPEALVAASSDGIRRNLRARTSFFDRVVVNALDRDVAQMVVVGAGYDGRALRYAKPGVRWFEVDHPDTQRDKQVRLERLGIAAPQITYIATDLSRSEPGRTSQPNQTSQPSKAGLAAALVEAGCQPDVPAQIVCEGLAVYLDVADLESLLGELRALATVGTRLALSLSSSVQTQDHAERRELFRAAVAAIGEPVLNDLTAESAEPLLAATSWRAVELSERARQAGFVVAAPDWIGGASTSSRPATTSRVGRYMESLYHRDGADSLPAHLEGAYRIAVAKARELDVGVWRIDRGDGPSWVARVFPASRPHQAAEADAEILRGLEAAGFPAERLASPEPVSLHRGQSVLVTEMVDGRVAPARPETFAKLGELLARLHALPATRGAAARPGGAWHHLAQGGGPADEIAAAARLLAAAEPRVPPERQGTYAELRDALERAEDCRGLPEGLLHPDFVPANTIKTDTTKTDTIKTDTINGPGGDLVLVDWAGAGRGPRLWSLGFLLWAAGMKGPRCIDAVVAGYRRETQLEPEELDRLAPAIMARAVVFEAWAWATGRTQIDEAAEGLAAIRDRAEKAAARARRAFDQTTNPTTNPTSVTTNPTTNQMTDQPTT